MRQLGWSGAAAAEGGRLQGRAQRLQACEPIPRPRAAHQGRMWLPLTLSTLSRIADAV